MIRSGTGKSLCVLDANGVTWHTLSGYKMRENLFTNPSFETGSGIVNVRTNLATNPSFEAATGTTVVRTNLAQNSSFEKTSGISFIRTNRFPNPSVEVGTTGYASAGVNPATLTRDTAVLWTGTASLKVTWSGAGNGLVETATSGSNAAGVTALSNYTASAYVRMANGANRNINLYINWFTSAGAYISQTPGTPVSATLNNWVRPSVVNAIAPATAAFASVGYNFGTVAATDVFNVDALLVENTTAALEYFDGSAPIQNLVTNPSLETNTTGWGGKGATLPTIAQSSDRAWIGSKSMKVTFTSNTVSQGVGVDVTGLTVGATYTMSGYVFAPTGTQDIQSTISGIGYGTIVSAKDVWTRTTMTFVATSTGHNVGFDGLGSAQTGKSFYVDGVMLNAGSVALSYVEGAGDFTYSWAGTPHASLSYQTGTGVDTVAGNRSNVYQAQSISRSGSKSLAVWANGYSDNPGAILNVGSATFVTGKQYTVSAYFYFPADPVAVRLGFSGPLSGVSSPVTPVAGVWTRVSHTFTASATTVLVVFPEVAATTPAAGTVYYIDDVLVEEGSIPGDYFDGANPIQNLAYSANMSLYWDARWFGGGTGDGTYAYQNSASPIGTGFLRKTWTVGTNNTNQDTGFHSSINSTVVPGSTITFSGWLRPSVGDKNGYARLLWPNGIPASNGAIVALPANTWTRVSVTAVVPAGVTTVAPALDIHTPGAFWAAGQTLDGTGALVERSSTVNDYYAGQGDFTYAWTGTANASTSTQTAPTVTGVQTVWGSVTGYQASSTMINGQKVFRDRWHTTSTAIRLFDKAAIGAGKTVTVSMYVRPTTSLTQVRLLSRTYTDTAGTTVKDEVVGSWFTCPANTITRVSQTLTTATGVQSVRPMLNVEQSVPAGNYIDYDAVVVEETNIVQPYFDGNFPVQGDFTHLWAGTAHASVSYMRATGVTNVFGNSLSAAIYSSDWAQSGTKSLRLRPLGNSADSFASIGGDVGSGLTLGMQAGKTYTAFATCRVKTLRVMGTTGRNIRVYWPDGTGGYTTTESPTALNAVGVYPLKLTFTIPPGKTEAFIRLYHATSNAFGDDDVWWDNFMLVEGDGTDINGYFDGNTPADEYFTYSWAGTPHASKSRATP